MNGSSIVFWAAFGGGAAAGAFTLLAVLIAEWLRWFLDRPLVRVSVSIGCLVNDETLHLFVEARNPHSKPVILNTFGLSFKRKEWGTMYVNPQRGYRFPYTLEGGHSLSQWTPVADFGTTLEKGERQISDLKWVWFRSSAGKEFRAKIPNGIIKALEHTAG